MLARGHQTHDGDRIHRGYRILSLWTALAMVVGAGFAVLSLNNKADAAVPTVKLPAEHAKYSKALESAGKRCQAVPAPVLAAHIEVSSRWNPRAVNRYTGQKGIAQMLPSVWKKFGVDGNKDGVKDIFNPDDAIASQSSYLCYLARNLNSDVRHGRIKNAHSQSLSDLVIEASLVGPGKLRRKGAHGTYHGSRHVKNVRTALMKYRPAARPGSTPKPSASQSAAPTASVPSPTNVAPTATVTQTPSHTGVTSGTAATTSRTGTGHHGESGRPTSTSSTSPAATTTAPRPSTSTATPPATAPTTTAPTTTVPRPTASTTTPSATTPAPTTTTPRPTTTTPSTTASSTTSPSPSTSVATVPLGQRILNAATKYEGGKFVWGGGGIYGPDSGFENYSGATVGFDCSGLVQYAVWVGTKAGTAPLLLDRIAHSQIHSDLTGSAQVRARTKVVGTATPGSRGRLTSQQRAVTNSMQVGDLLAIGSMKNGSINYFHIAIYAGNDRIFQSSDSSRPIGYAPITNAGGDYWRVIRFTE